MFEDLPADLMIVVELNDHGLMATWLTARAWRQDGIAFTPDELRRACKITKVEWRQYNRILFHNSLPGLGDLANPEYVLDYDIQYEPKTRAQARCSYLGSRSINNTSKDNYTAPARGTLASPTPSPGVTPTALEDYIALESDVGAKFESGRSVPRTWLEYASGYLGDDSVPESQYGPLAVLAFWLAQYRAVYEMDYVWRTRDSVTALYGQVLGLIEQYGVEKVLGAVRMFFSPEFTRMTDRVLFLSFKPDWFAGLVARYVASRRNTEAEAGSGGRRRGQVQP